MAPQKGKPRGSAETAIYDGLRFVGSFAPSRAGFVAYDRRGRRLGAFETKDAARLAIVNATVSRPLGKT